MVFDIAMKSNREIWDAIFNYKIEVSTYIS